MFDNNNIMNGIIHLHNNSAISIVHMSVMMLTQNSGATHVIVEPRPFSVCNPFKIFTPTATKCHIKSYMLVNAFIC